MPKVTGAGGVQEYTPQEIYDAVMSDQWFDYASDESPKINIVSPAGETVSVDFNPENMKQVFDLGWGFESREMEHHGWVKQEYGGKSGELSAALLGAARGLTFGGSDLALTKAGIYTPEELDNWRTASPKISLASEITGAVLPVVVSGGAAAPGTGRGILKQIFSKAPTAQTAKMAAQLEAKLASALKTTASPSLVKRAIAKGISKGVPVALEGGVYGAGIGLSESVLKDKPLLSEETAAYMGMGALIGGIMGVGLPAVKGLVFGERAPAVVGAYKPFPGLTGKTKDIYASLSGLVSGRDRKVIREFLENKEARQAAIDWHKNLPDFAETIAKSGERFDRSILVAQEEVRALLRPPITAAEAAAKSLKKGQLAVPSEELLEFSKRFTSEQTKAVKQLVKHGQEYNKIRISNRKLYREKLFDTDFFGEQLRGPNRVSFLKNIQREVKASEKLYESLTNPKLPISKNKVPVIKWWDPKLKKTIDIADITKALDDSLPLAESSARLEIKLAGLGEPAKGALSELLPGGLTGGLAYLLGGGFKGAIGIGALTQALRNPASIIKGFHRITNMVDWIIERKITQALMKTKYRAPVGASIGVRAYEAWREGEKKKTRKDILQNKQETFQYISSKLKPLADPEVLQERMNANLANLQEEFPDIAQDLNMTVQKAVSHLLATMPSAMSLNTVDALQGKQPYISEVELTKFFRRIVAVEDPLSVLEDLTHASISREAVETVREVYPRLYAKMVTDIMDAVAARKEPISYTMKVQLTYLLGMPMDSTLTPEFIAQAQMNLRPEGPTQGMPPPAGPRGAKVSRMSVANQTKAQSIEAKRAA